MKKFLRLLAIFIFALAITLAGCNGLGNILPPPNNVGDEQTNTQTPDGKPSDGQTQSPDEPFNDYGFEVIAVYLSEVNVDRDGIYTSKEEVGAYIYLFHRLPTNFKTKSEFNRKNYTAENKLSTGGDVFYNREGLLPEKAKRTYTECDIDYTGGARNAKRIVFSSDWLIFYTDTHYASYKIMRFYEA